MTDLELVRLPGLTATLHGYPSCKIVTLSHCSASAINQASAFNPPAPSMPAPVLIFYLPRGTSAIVTGSPPRAAFVQPQNCINCSSGCGWRKDTAGTTHGMAALLRSNDTNRGMATHASDPCIPEANARYCCRFQASLGYSATLDQPESQSETLISKTNRRSIIKQTKAKTKKK